MMVIQQGTTRSGRMPPQLGRFWGHCKKRNIRMPLNDTQIRKLKPKEKPYKVSDFEGLYFTVTPTGSKLWHMKYRIDAREKRLSFGIYPKVTLAQARSLRDEAKALLANGTDPGVAKQEQKQRRSAANEQTFPRMVVERHAKLTLLAGF
jgi:hypothetical protein